MPAATLVGPSLNLFNLKVLGDFLRYAAAQGVLPDVLTWHELGDDGRAMGTDTAHLRSLLRSMNLESKIQRLAVNEYNSQQSSILPGSAGSFLAAAARANLSHAMHSCWADMGGCGQTCTEVVSNLNGLLSCERAPRPAWWVYRLYSFLEGSFVAVRQRESAGTLDAVASVALGKDGDDRPPVVRVLVSSFPRVAPLPLPHDPAAERNVSLRVELAGSALAGSKFLVETECVASGASSDMHPKLCAHSACSQPSGASASENNRAVFAPTVRPARTVGASAGGLELAVALAAQEVCLLTAYGS